MDTSVWIDYLGGRETEVTGRFAKILNRGFEVGLTGVVYQEVVQGVSSREAFDRTSQYLGSLRFYHPRETPLKVTGKPRESTSIVVARG